MISRVRKLAKTQVRERVSPEEWEVRVNLAACFDFMYCLKRACQAQISAMAGGAKLRIQSREIAEKVARQFARPGYQETKPEWKALLRMLDRMDVSFRD